jgi:hypothetical protein
MKLATKPITAAAMETDRSDPSKTVVGSSAELVTPAFITDDR